MVDRNPCGSDSRTRLGPLCPEVNLLQREGHRRGRIEDAGVGNQSKELDQTVSRNSPCFCPLREIAHNSEGAFVPGSLISVGIDEDVSVDRDHRDRPTSGMG